MEIIGYVPVVEEVVRKLGSNKLRPLKPNESLRTNNIYIKNISIRKVKYEWRMKQHQKTLKIYALYRGNEYSRAWVDIYNFFEPIKSGRTILIWINSKLFKSLDEAVEYDILTNKFDKKINTKNKPNDAKRY